MCMEHKRKRVLADELQPKRLLIETSRHLGITRRHEHDQISISEHGSSIFTATRGGEILTPSLASEQELN